MKSLRDDISTKISIFVLFFPCLIARSLSHRSRVKLASIIAWFFQLALPKRVQIAQENLKRALPQIDSQERELILQRHLKNLALSLIELFAFSQLDMTTLQALVEIEGREHLDQALTLKRGVLICSAHIGNWELLLRTGVLSERSVHVLSKRLSSPWAQKIWDALRRGTPRRHDLASQNRARSLLKALSRGEIVADVLDQHDPSARALRLPFFREKASTSTALARLSIRSGAPILPVFIYRESSRHRVVISAPITLDQRSSLESSSREHAQTITLRLLKEVEEAILHDPTQWLWIHRRWKEPPPSQRPL